MSLIENETSQRRSGLRTLGLLMLGSAALCMVIAFDRYSSAYKTAQAVAESLEVELVSFAIPMSAKIVAFFGVIFLVAGLRLVYQSRKTT